MSIHTRKRPNILQPFSNLAGPAIARDQLATLVLQGISKVPSLSNNLVLKGAGALRQCYFEDARLTDDLDFSATEAYKTVVEPHYQMVEAAYFIQSELLKFSPLGAGKVKAERVIHRTPPPVPLQTFRFVFQRSTPCQQDWASRLNQQHSSVSVAVEIALTEVVVRRAPLFPLIRPSDECTYVGQVRLYDFEELVAEKLRALLQWRQQVRKGRVNISVATAYFDLWWLSHIAPVPRRQRDFLGLFKEKCAWRNVSYETLDDFFDYELVWLAMESWERNRLKGLVATLPSRPAMLEGASRFIANWLNLPLMRCPAWRLSHGRYHFG